MCGISGICNFERKPSLETVKKMSLKLRHRGPDDEGCFINDYVCLGHTRLSIIDLNKSKQPMIDENNKNVLIFNGEIYNFKELKNELKQLGYKFKTDGDTEVILKSYKEWGMECLKRFEGMFVFIIWDNKKNELIVARDRMGEKPLFYYYSRENGLIFTSEIKAFLAVKEIKQKLKLNEESLNQYLSLNYLINNQTFFKDIYSLEPASYLIINKNNIKNIKSIKYWNLENYFKNKTEDSYETCIKKINELIATSTRKRFFSNVTNGVFLSGGLDSSTLSYQLNNIENDNFDAHNIAFKEVDFDEYRDAKIISDFFNVNLFSYNIPIADQLANEFPNIVEAMDQPMSDTSFIATYYLSKFSSKKSKMVLSGDGADELFCGYDTFIADKFRNFFPKIKFKLNLIPNILNYLFKSKVSKVGINYKINKFINGVSHEKNHSHVLWREIFTLFEKKKIIKSDHYKHMNYNFLNYIDEQNKLVADLNYIDRYLYIDLKTWLPNDILYKIDRSTMYNSQEARVPFLDSKLVEYCSSLPVKSKLNFFKRKRILRDAMANKLPNKTLFKKKSGFNSPIGVWLQETGKFKEMSYYLIKTKKMQNIFNTDEIEKIWKSHQDNKFDESFKIFNLMCLSQWLENNSLSGNL